MSNLHFSQKSQVKNQRTYKPQKLRRKDTGATQDDKKGKDPTL